MKRIACIAVALWLSLDVAVAKRPQVLPEPMLVNLFALTDAAATLQICARSDAYRKLRAGDKALLKRLQGNIDDLVRKIAVKFDEDLFGFFVQSRDEAAALPKKVEATRQRYGFCGNGLLERMTRYIADSKQRLDYFLSQLPDAR